MISKQLLFPVISFDFTKKRKLSSISTFWGIGHIHKQVAGDATGGVEKSGRRRRGLLWVWGARARPRTPHRFESISAARKNRQVCAHARNTRKKCAIGEEREGERLSKRVELRGAVGAQRGVAAGRRRRQSAAACARVHVGRRAHSAALRRGGAKSAAPPVFFGGSASSGEHEGEQKAMASKGVEF